MAETIHLRGEGGAVFAMDLPLPESIADRYAAGHLTRVRADGSPYQGSPAQPTGQGAPDGEDPGDEGSDLTAGRTPRPGVNASKSEWIAYVVSQGHMSTEDAANYTKADLIELVS